MRKPQKQNSHAIGTRGFVSYPYTNTSYQYFTRPSTNASSASVRAVYSRYLDTFSNSSNGTLMSLQILPTVPPATSPLLCFGTTVIFHSHV